MARSPSDDPVDRLLSRSLQSRAAAAGDVCPDAELLAAYVDGGLAPDEAARFEAHASSCARCVSVLAAAVASERAAAAPASAGWWSLGLLKWAVPLGAAAVLAAGIWLVIPGSSVRDEGQVALNMPAEAPVAQSGPTSSTIEPGDDTPRKALEGARADEAEARSRTMSREALPKREAAVEETRQEKSLADSAAANEVDAVGAPRSEPQRPRAANEVAVPTAAPAPAEIRPASQAAAVAAPPPPPAAPPQPAPQAAEANQGRLVAGGALAESETGATTVEETPVRRQPADLLTLAPGTSAPGPARGGGGGGGGRAGGRGGQAVVLVRVSDTIAWRARGTAIERSTDGQATWTSEFVAEQPLVGGSAVSADVAWFFTRGGGVVRRADKGWSSSRVPGGVEIASITATSATDASVRLTDGRQMRTADGGESWLAVQ